MVLFMSAALHIACDDEKEQYLDDYRTILYFRNSGEIEYAINKIDETGVYTVSVVKAGSDNRASAAVDLKIMDQAMLAAYNSEKGTDYQIFPAGCYSIETGTISFGASESYQAIDLSLHTAAIETVLEENSSAHYIVPLYLSNASDSVNEEKKYLFLKPKVIAPAVGFEKTGYVMNSFSASSEPQLDFTLGVNLSIENKWTFDCYTEVNADLLETYNKEQNSNFILLPSESYTIHGNGTVGMNPGEDGSLKFTVDRSSLNYGNYILPLWLTRTSIDKIEADPERNICLFGISYVPEQSSLQPVRLAENCISYYPNSLCEGSVEGLFDNDPDTYYHSDWSAGIPLPHWLEFTLPTECSAFRFEYLTRNAGEHVVPRRISLYGSADGIEFKKIVTTDDLPYEVGSTYASPVLVAGGKIKYIRLTVEHSLSGSFALAEFKLWTL